MSGWVRNRRDGSVEAVFAGEDAQVAGMLLALRDGPQASRVKQVQTVAFDDEVTGGFEVRETV